jgi:hypothetical protein
VLLAEIEPVAEHAGTFAGGCISEGDESCCCVGYCVGCFAAS